MVEITGNEIDTLTETEVKSVMRRKFLRIRMSERVYCFRIMQVKEILDGKNCEMEVKHGFNDYENVYGFMQYEDERIPVFNLDNEHSPMGSINFESTSVLVMDVLSNGFILQLGILVNRIYDIFHAIMSELGEDMTREQDKE